MALRLEFDKRPAVHCAVEELEELEVSDVVERALAARLSDSMSSAYVASLSRRAIGVGAKARRRCCSRGATARRRNAGSGVEGRREGLAMCAEDI